MSNLAIEQASKEALALLPLQTTRTSPDTFFHGLLLAYRTFNGLTIPTNLSPFYTVVRGYEGAHGYSASIVQEVIV